MPQCEQRGKDVICFASKEELATPSTVSLPPPEQPAGLILENGEINWNCPCLGGMATGPCGVEFRSAFSCFHYSENEPKGAECLEAFQAMQDCMKQYPTLYKQSDDEDDIPEIPGINESPEVELLDSEHHNISEKNIQQMDQKTVEKTKQ
ncbi:mitochondrial intermembrane space import and assembly protein 40-B [Chrysoperla carnea]|uniref:mitochondrial intermembrane space import and assembly protein 40-B n=1 Tax=Chrysoperla carnea TaxID=189513 RepID=UPI001D05CDAE|nr:mitochondrial intermembrane space import and assembly protein 40-B [Chrysoperla carnea]